MREAITASLIGLAVVAIFLLLVYRFLGLVAIIGLALNFAFLYAVILLFDVTLTLPGFAGMILAIGVAADANIVIFERIKEEAAERKFVRAAISAGYRKGSRRSSTRTSSRRSRPDPVHGRDGRRPRLRVSAPARHRDLDYGRLRHASAARAPRRLPLVRQPEVHGRERPEDGRLADVRRGGQASDLVHDRRRADCASIGSLALKCC